MALIVGHSHASSTISSAYNKTQVAGFNHASSTIPSAYSRIQGRSFKLRAYSCNCLMQLFQGLQKNCYMAATFEAFMEKEPSIPMSTAENQVSSPNLGAYNHKHASGTTPGAYSKQSGKQHQHMEPLATDM